jgi:hypothetical protein
MRRADVQQSRACHSSERNQPYKSNSPPFQLVAERVMSYLQACVNAAAGRAKEAESAAIAIVACHPRGESISFSPIFDMRWVPMNITHRLRR